MKTAILFVVLALFTQSFVNAQCDEGCAVCTSPGLNVPGECQQCADSWTLNVQGTLCIQSCPAARQFQGVNNAGRKQCFACSPGCNVCSASGLGVDVCFQCNEDIGWSLDLAEAVCVASCPIGQFVDTTPARDQCEPCTTGCAQCRDRSLDIISREFCAAPAAGAACIACDQINGWRLNSEGCTCVSACDAGEYNDQTTGTDICVACTTGCADCDGPGLSTQCNLCDQANGWLLNLAGTSCVSSCPVGQIADRSSAIHQCAVCSTGCAVCTGLGLTSDVCSACDESIGWLWNFAGDTCVEECAAGLYEDLSGVDQCQLCSTGCAVCTGVGLTSDVCSACDESIGWLLNFAGDTCVEECAPGLYEDLTGVDQCQLCSTGCAVCTDVGLTSDVCSACDESIGWLWAVSDTVCVESCGAAEFEDLVAVDQCELCTTGCAVCSDVGLTTDVCSACDVANGWGLNLAGDTCVNSCGAGQFEDADGNCVACSIGCAVCTGLGVTADVCSACDESIGWLWSGLGIMCVEECAPGRYEDLVGVDQCQPCSFGCAECTADGLSLDICSVCDEANDFYVSVDGLFCTQCTETQYVDTSVTPAVCVEHTMSESRTFGDPHMVGLLGQKYLFDGEVDKIYNVISTPNLQVNMQLIHSNDGDVELAVIGEIGIVAGDDAIFINKDARLRINNVLATDLTVLSDTKSSVIRDTFHDGKGIVVRTPEFLIRMIPRGYEVDIKEIRMLRRGDKSVHGIVGQTWSAANWPSSAFSTEITDQNTLFNGLLEGSSVADYEVKDGLFGSNFTFSRFDKVAHPNRHVLPAVSKSN